MKSPLRLYHDDEGLPRAEWIGDETGGRLLAEFLETDLGGDTSYAARILAEARALAKAKDAAKPWKCSGNAFSLTLDGETAKVRSLFGKKGARPFVTPTAEFVKHVRRWRKLVENDAS